MCVKHCREEGKRQPACCARGALRAGKQARDNQNSVHVKHCGQAGNTGQKAIFHTAGVMNDRCRKHSPSFNYHQSWKGGIFWIVSTRG